MQETNKVKQQLSLSVSLPQQDDCKTRKDINTAQKKTRTQHTQKKRKQCIEAAIDNESTTLKSVSLIKL